MTHTIPFEKCPYNRLAPVPVNSVELADSFWAPRQAINREVTLATQYQHCEDTARIDNFRRVSGRKDCEFKGIFFNDSDVYKLLEAIAWASSTKPVDRKLTAMADALIDEIAAAQDVDGYLNTYFSLERKGQRWTNLKDMHELYCAGHLIEAAVAHFQATGKRSLLDVACRLADHIGETFGPASEGKREGACGHEEIELALVTLSRVTGENRYWKQARYFVDARGATPPALYYPGITGKSTPLPQPLSPPGKGEQMSWDFDRRYHQDHARFVDQADVTGHAVRQMYLDCGAADVYAESGDPALLGALEKQWENMTGRRMYVTGGLGARWDGESFGGDWELPDRAYAETCAAIGSIMWNKRMLQIDGDSRYADLMELQLYNAMLAGISLDGGKYFYQNPLADDGGHRRQPWFGCACCPPNIARLLASLGGYFYSTEPEAVWVHLYARGSARFELGAGVVRLRQETNYPWDGDVTITVDEVPADFKVLNVRISEWASGASVQVNDEATKPVAAGAYARVERRWSVGDTLRVRLPMGVRSLTADPRVAACTGKVTLARGPIVYCLEQADHGDVDVRDIAVAADAKVEARFAPEMLGGVVVLQMAGVVIDRSAWGNRLYANGRSRSYVSRAVEVVAVPYYAWANREAGPMIVWINAI